MSNRDDYDALLPAIRAISDDAVRPPTQPVDSFAQEAETLYHWAQADREALEAAGLDWTLVEALPARAGALREAESIWLMQRFTRAEAQRQWKVAEPEAYELRDDLLAALRYAYRRSPDLLGRVSAIAEGRGRPDMILDLNAIAALGRQHPEPLVAIGFDLARLDAAAAKSDALAKLLAARESDDPDDPPKKVRDQAFTYLKQAVDEVRDCGRYVFRKSPQRAAGYASQYARRHRGRSESTDGAEAETN